MVERRVCTFCGAEIEPGTGSMYIKKDGVIYNFCSSKCHKNLVHMGRVPRRTTWTRYYEREKALRLKSATEPVETKKRKVKNVKTAKPKVEVKEVAAEEIPEKTEKTAGAVKAPKKDDGAKGKKTTASKGAKAEDKSE